MEHSLKDRCRKRVTIPPLVAAVLAILTTACSSSLRPPLVSGTAPQPTAYRPPRFIDLNQLSGVETRAARAGKGPSAGTTVSVDIPSTQSGFDAREARVYLPPDWFTMGALPLPTLVLLPGVPGGPTVWTQDGDADLIANEFVSHGGVAPIIVMPDATGSDDDDSECVNSSKFGNVETYLTADVPAYVRSTFRAASGPGSLAVAGLSAGGTCSTVLALRNPGIFHTFASFSGFDTPTYLDDTVAESVPILYSGSGTAYLAHDPMTLLAHNKYPMTSAWFEAGTGDHQPWTDAQQLAAASRQAGMAEVCLLGIPGGHSWEVWRESFSSALPWLSARLGLTSSTTGALDGCTADAR
jgi:S-formylglutathione hydrolase FrmB